MSIGKNTRVQSYFYSKNRRNFRNFLTKEYNIFTLKVIKNRTANAVKTIQAMPMIIKIFRTFGE